MRKLPLIMSAVLVLGTGHAQQLSELMKPVPEAVCKVAPMPEEMAKKFARLEKERRDKYITPVSAVPMSIDADIVRKKNLHLVPEGEAFQIKYREDSEYLIYSPNIRIKNTSHGREKVKDERGKFNAKKDRMSYAILRNGSEICIINHEHKPVDMNDFSFSTTSEAFVMDGNKIVFTVPTLYIAAGKYPMEHKVKCEHKSSDAKYTFDIEFYWTKKLYHSGELHAFALTPIKSDAADNRGLLCDLDDKQLRIVELPLLIEADGHDGANGKKGRFGANGINQKTYTDKNGNTKTVAGTCAKPGQDGSDGQDGTDGGRFLLCISQDMMDLYGPDGLIVTIDAGKGGKGGKGGEGGIHGKGSGCTGKAPDGKDGKDGKDGQRGDFLYVLADVNSFYQQIFK